VENAATQNQNFVSKRGLGGDYDRRSELESRNCSSASLSEEVARFSLEPAPLKLSSSPSLHLLPSSLRTFKTNQLLTYNQQLGLLQTNENKPNNNKFKSSLLSSLYKYLYKIPATIDLNLYGCEMYSEQGSSNKILYKNGFTGNQLQVKFHTIKGKRQESERYQGAKTQVQTKAKGAEHWKNKQSREELTPAISRALYPDL
jgi:hypothetical protein